MTRIVKSPDERRNELIACAQRLFFSKGYERTTVSDIVDELGVAKGTFYYYFDSKQAIMEAMVDEVINQSVALLHEIVADETLPVLVKWTRASQVTDAWKAERKTELLAMLRVIQMDENMLLRYKVQTRTMELISPELAKIIAQGVEEGVFETESVEDAAEIALSVMQSLADTIYSIILAPEDYDDPLALARRKITSVETSIERMLGAPPGSLYLIDIQELAAWLKDEGQQP